MDTVRVEDFLDISYRPDLDVLVARWLRPVDLPELQVGYEQILAAARAGGPHHRWLIDVRRRFNTHELGAQWMISSFLPLVGPTLGGRTRVAYLLAPVYLRDSAADSAFPPPSYFVDKPFLGDRFTQEDVAIEWLCAVA